MKTVIEWSIFFIVGFLIKLIDQSFDFYLYMLSCIFYQVIQVKHQITEIENENSL